jgi:hypothetical protein
MSGSTAKIISSCARFVTRTFLTNQNTAALATGVLMILTTTVAGSTTVLGQRIIKTF